MKFLQILIKLFFGLLRSISILIYGILIFINFFKELVDTSSVWLYVALAIFPITIFLEVYVKPFLQKQKLSLRRYLEFCFILLQFSSLVLVQGVINEFALLERQPFDLESASALVLFNGLFFGIAWMWWGKIQRDTADVQIKEAFLAVKQATPANDKNVIDFVKSTPILKHRFLANDAGERYYEYFPVMVVMRKYNLFFGAHFYDETIKGGSNYISQTHRHAFWYFDLDLPDLVVKKRSKMAQTFSATALNPEQAKQSKMISSIFEKHDFKSMEIKNGACLMIRKFPANYATLGEVPLATSQLEEINQSILELL